MIREELFVYTNEESASPLDAVDHHRQDQSSSQMEMMASNATTSGHFHASSDQTINPDHSINDHIQYPSTNNDVHIVNRFESLLTIDNDESHSNNGNMKPPLLVEPQQNDAQEGLANDLSNQTLQTEADLNLNGDSDWKMVNRRQKPISRPVRSRTLSMSSNGSAKINLRPSCRKRVFNPLMSFKVGNFSRLRILIKTVIVHIPEFKANPHNNEAIWAKIKREAHKLGYIVSPRTQIDCGFLSLVGTYLKVLSLIQDIEMGLKIWEPFKIFHSLDLSPIVPPEKWKIIENERIRLSKNKSKLQFNNTLPNSYGSLMDVQKRHQQATTESMISLKEAIPFNVDLSFQQSNIHGISGDEIYANKNNANINRRDMLNFNCTGNVIQGPPSYYEPFSFISSTQVPSQSAKNSLHLISTQKLSSSVPSSFQQSNLLPILSQKQLNMPNNSLPNVEDNIVNSGPVFEAFNFIGEDDWKLVNSRRQKPLGRPIRSRTTSLSSIGSSRGISQNENSIKKSYLPVHSFRVNNVPRLLILVRTVNAYLPEFKRRPQEHKEIWAKIRREARNFGYVVSSRTQMDCGFLGLTGTYCKVLAIVNDVEHGQSVWALFKAFHNLDLSPLLGEEKWKIIESERARLSESSKLPRPIAPLPTNLDEYPALESLQFKSTEQNQASITNANIDALFSQNNSHNNDRRHPLYDMIKWGLPLNENSEQPFQSPSNIFGPFAINNSFLSSSLYEHNYKTEFENNISGSPGSVSSDLMAEINLDAIGQKLLDDLDESNRSPSKWTESDKASNCAKSDYLKSEPLSGPLYAPEPIDPVIKTDEDFSNAYWMKRYQFEKPISDWPFNSLNNSEKWKNDLILTQCVRSHLGELNDSSDPQKVWKMISQDFVHATSISLDNSTISLEAYFLQLLKWYIAVIHEAPNLKTAKKMFPLFDSFYYCSSLWSCLLTQEESKQLHEDRQKLRATNLPSNQLWSNCWV